jgi:hypothetical protein
MFASDASDFFVHMETTPDVRPTTAAQPTKAGTMQFFTIGFFIIIIKNPII